MAYKFIKIQALPQNLEDIIEDDSPVQAAIDKEIALAHAAPDLLEALQLAKATIERMERHASGQGTIHVIDKALRIAGVSA